MFQNQSSGSAHIRPADSSAKYPNSACSMTMRMKIREPWWWWWWWCLELEIINPHQFGFIIICVSSGIRAERWCCFSGGLLRYGNGGKHIFARGTFSPINKYALFGETQNTWGWNRRQYSSQLISDVHFVVDVVFEEVGEGERKVISRRRQILCVFEKQTQLRLIRRNLCPSAFVFASTITRRRPSIKYNERSPTTIHNRKTEQGGAPSIHQMQLFFFF